MTIITKTATEITINVNGIVGTIGPIVGATELSHWVSAELLPIVEDDQDLIDELADLAEGLVHA